MAGIYTDYTLIFNTIAFTIIVCRADYYIVEPLIDRVIT